MAEVIKLIQRSKYSLGFNLPGTYKSIRGVSVSLIIAAYKYLIATQYSSYIMYYVLCQRYAFWLPVVPDGASRV